MLNNKNAISHVYLCNVPISPTHQIDFKNIAEQKNYFQNKVVTSYTPCSYQPRTSVIKIKQYVDDVKANYGFYINEYNGTEKTFYFWILEQNYVNKGVTALTIQIDVFQTWLFDFSLKECFIEREMVSNDAIGINTFPESFELGDYVTSSYYPISELMGNPCFFVAVVSSDGGGIFGKQYSGLTYKYFPYDKIAEMNNYIQGLNEKGKGDSIAYIFSFPSKLLNTEHYSAGNGIGGYEGTCSKTINYNLMDKKFTFNNREYTPKNNKLYTYPYNFITVVNDNGSNVVLKIENFANTENIRFILEGVLTPNPTFTLSPIEYCKRPTSYQDSISTQGYGLCSWINDNYSNWFAQHKNSIRAQSANATASYMTNDRISRNNYNNALENRNTSTEKSIINTALSTVNNLAHLNILGGITNAVSGGANAYLDYKQNTKNAENDLSNSRLVNKNSYQNEVRSLMASVKDAQVQPNTCKGDTSSSGLDLARNTATFFIEQTHIKPEYAEMIDNYFQMYGYRVNRVGIPNINSRKKWNYTKTVGCKIVGSIPTNDIAELESFFDNGFTIWHDESYMFKYEEINDII